MSNIAVDDKQEIRPTAGKNLLILLVFFAVTFINVKLFGDGDILRGLMVLWVKILQSRKRDHSNDLGIS
jgi:hypothetical protein